MTSNNSTVPVFLERKWRYFASVLDHDKDGYVSRKDHLELAERAISVGNIDPNSTRAVQIRRKLGQTFDNIFGPIKAGEPVTYDEVVQSFNERGELLQRVVHQNLEIFFDMIDSSGDGLIQREEFKQFFFIFHIDVDQADRVFESIDEHKSGEIEMNEFMTFSLQFFFSTDENHPSKNFLGFLPQF